MEFTRQQKLIVFLLGFMGFWIMGDNFAAAPVIVDIARDFSLDIGTAAITVAAYMLPFGLFTLIFGPLADKHGKAKVLSVAAFGTAIFSALGAAAFNISSLSVIRAINGGFAAAFLPVTMSLVGDSFEKPEDAQNAIGTVLGMYFLGAAAATGIGGGLSYLGSWRLVYLAYGIAEFPIAISIFLTLERKPGVSGSLNFRKVYGEALDRPDLIKAVALLSLVGFAVFGSFTYMGEYIQTSTGLNLLGVGLILSLFGIAAVISGRQSGRLKKKLGNKLLAFAGLVGLIALAVTAVKPIMVLLIPALVGYGFAFIILQSTLITSAQQVMPKRRGTVMALASFNLFIGGAIGVQLNRMILKTGGYGIVFFIAGAVLLLAGIIASIKLEKTPGKGRKNRNRPGESGG
ncbi:MAG: MFS transporter [Candidatus Acetothermia bacterium]